MKLAIFYPQNTYAGWYSLGGYRNALRRMGHDVLDCPLPGNVPHDLEAVRAKLPTLETLGERDGIISFYHEYTQPWIAALYGEAWLALRDRVVARFDESMDRGDLGLPPRLAELMRWAKYASFPAAQDAKKYAGDWAPFGADTEMFKPYWEAKPHEKKYGAAFVGSLYGPRMAYVQGLAQIPDSVTLQCGEVGVKDLNGLRQPESTEMLAETYRQIKVFFCLPALSRLVVGKISEVMACGTFVMYPRLHGEYAENLSLFENNKHLVLYEVGYFRENVKQLKRWLADDAERERIAAAGADLVRRELTIEKMLDRILTPIAREMLTAPEKVLV